MSMEIYAQSLPVQVTHVPLPYDLTEERLLAELETPFHSIEECLDFIRDGDVTSTPGEKERMLVTTGILLSKGVDLQIALCTALVWERG